MTRMDWSTPAFPDIDFARDDVPDLPVLMADLLEQGRFVPIRFHDSVACLITHYDDVKAAFKDEETFPAAAAHREHTEPVLGPTMTTMMGRDHQINRALVSHAFRPVTIRKAVEPLLEPLAEELVDQFAPRGSAELMDEFARPMAFRVITRYMGIPVEDEPQILEWGSALLRFAWEPEPALEGAARIRQYLLGVVDARRREQGEDLISELTRAEIDGRRLDDQEVITAILSLFAAGIDSPANAIGNLVAAVLSMPGLAARARAHPEILPALTEESLRFVPSAAIIPRKCPKATTWRGMDFPADSSVIFGITSAHRDPDAFPDPDRFDPDRKMVHSILSFGQGVHLCPGAHLARNTIQVALRILLERLPDIELAEPESVETVGGVLRGPRALPVVFGPAS